MNPVISFLIVAGCTYAANFILSFLLPDFNYAIYDYFGYFEIQKNILYYLASFINGINPLKIPIEYFLSSFYREYEICVITQLIWDKPFVAYSSNYFSIQQYILPFILWATGPGLCFLIAKNFSKQNIHKESTTTILTIKNIIHKSRQLGLQNSGTILGTMILWIMTIWIPYLNVGTTIGLLGMIVSLGKKENFSPTDIFDGKYRKNMGEFFLLLAFMSIGISIGSFFVIIPGIVIGIAWSQSILLLIDKGLSPLEAIKISNDITHGEKFTMTIGYILVMLVYGLIIGIGLVISIALDSELLAVIIAIVGYFIMSLILLGFASYIYSELSKKL